MGTTYDIGLAAIAYKCDAQNFLHSLDCDMRRQCKLRVLILTEQDCPPQKDEQFNLSKAKNKALRLLMEDCPIIATADVDQLIPPGLMDYLAHETRDRHMWVQRRDIQPQEVREEAWADWMKLPIFGTSEGCFNCLSRENWLKVGGWEERCYGWGGEDNVLHERIRMARIPRIIINSYPLVHIAHPPRVWRTEGKRSQPNTSWLTVNQPNYLL